MTSGRGWAVFLVGAAVGAALALLYAPQSGEKTRKQVKRNLEDAGDCIKDAAEEVGVQTKRAYRGARGTVGTVIDFVR